MNNSTFLLPDEELDTIASHYRFNADTNTAENCGKNIQRYKLGSEYESGGAGLVSTVEDYIRFADAMACGGVAKNGYRVLSEEGLKQLTSEQLKEITINNSFTCVQGDDYGYGLGVRIRRVATDWGLNKGEFGWDGAACSYVMVDPEKKISIFIGAHLRNWPFVFTDKHLSIVEKVYKTFQF